MSKRFTESDGKTGLDIKLFCRVDILDYFVEAWQKSEENLIIDKTSLGLSDTRFFEFKSKEGYGPK